MRLLDCMIKLSLSIEDRRWMRRRLQTSACLMMAMACFSAILRWPGSTASVQATSADVPSEKITADQASDGGDHRVQGAADPVTEHVDNGMLKSEDRPVFRLIGHRQTNPVIPDGWRKTKDGWQHTSSWPHLKGSLSEIVTINQLIAQQQASEPPWTRQIMLWLASVPPLAIAVAQILAIWMIVKITNRGNAENRTPKSAALG